MNLTEFLDNNEILTAITFVVGGLVLGFIFENIILARLRNASKKTKWKGDEVITESIQGIVTLWFVLGGAYAATQQLSLAQDTQNIISKVLLMIIVLSGSAFLSKLIIGAMNAYGEKAGKSFHGTSIFTKLTRILIYAIGILIILQSFGISITPILGALGVGGLAIGLALKDPLSNLFAGLNIIAARQIKKGDYIELESKEAGYIEDITWRNTVIRALSNNLVIIPNSKLSSAIVTNFNKPQEEMAVLIPIGVSYDSDLEQVEQTTVEVAKEAMKKFEPNIEEFEPSVSFCKFDDFSINFNVILRTSKFVNQYQLRHNFIKMLHKAYIREKINIPFPEHTVHMIQE